MSVAEATPPEAEQPPAEPPAPKPPTLAIQGHGDVLVSEIRPFFDAKCSRRCYEGVRKVWRPAPRPFRGTVEDRELCDCAVRGWIKAHPIEAPPAVGLLARAAAERQQPATPARNPRAEQVARLRERTNSARVELGAILAAEGEQVAALGDDLAREEAALYEASARADRIAGVDVALRLQIAEVMAELDRLQVVLEAANGERSTAEADIRAAASRVVAARARVESTREAHGPERRAAERKVEKLQRRIARVLGRHPEADGG